MNAWWLATTAALAAMAGVPLVQQAAPPAGVVRAGEYRVNPQGGPAPGASGTVYDVGPFPLSTPQLPDGEGRDATVAMCSVCHSVRYITMQPPLPPEAWRATVRKMVDVHGAPIPQDVAERITTYLQERFAAKNPM